MTYWEQRASSGQLALLGSRRVTDRSLSLDKELRRHRGTSTQHSKLELERRCTREGRVHRCVQRQGAWRCSVSSEVEVHFVLAEYALVAE